MKIEQRQWKRSTGWVPALETAPCAAQLLLVFSDTALLKDPAITTALRGAYPQASIVGCTTAGEILGTEVSEESVVVTAVTFEHSQLQSARVQLHEFGDSIAAGEALAAALPQQLPGLNGAAPEPLGHVFVLSDGLKVNGSDLVAGMMKRLPAGVVITGGLAGDGARFGETLTLWNSEVAAHTIVAIGFYGRRLRIGCASLGGWDSFGAERLVTRSSGNVLYELDGHSALELYKQYLGEYASGLPATGLLFPLSLRTKEGGEGVVRTILNVDDAQQSMTFAGDIPLGSRVRLMKTNFDRLIDGATAAATTCFQAVNATSPDLAILISCVGRKLVLKQRIEEEVEGVRSVLGAVTALAGFYSYGEIAPFTRGGHCELHNQTMTITTFAEV